MSKVFNWMVILTGTLLLIQLAGIDTPSSQILTKFIDFNHPENITLLNLITLGGGIFLLVGLTGALVGFFIRTSPEAYLTVGYYSVLLTVFATDTVGIWIKMKEYGGWESNVVGIVMAALVIGAIHSVISEWAGR